MIWPLFILFVVGHLLSNYKAVKSVVMETFNRNRFHILVRHYLRPSSHRQVLDTKLVNQMEPVLFNCASYFKQVRLGCSVSHFDSLTQLRIEKFSSQKYLIKFDVKAKATFIILDEVCQDEHLLKALLQIELVDFIMTNPNCLFDWTDLTNLKVALQKSNQFLFCHKLVSKLEIWFRLIK